MKSAIMTKRGMGQGLAGSGAPADFDHPLEMLSACHDRIEERCDLLHRLVNHLAAAGCDEQARQAAMSVLRYFDSAGQHHHEDEEQDVFPALRATGEAGAAQLVAKLRAEHAEMGRAWERLRFTLATLAAGTGAGLQADEVKSFTTLYRDHIAHEETELLPLARNLLDESTLRAIGGAMAKRRGVEH